MRVVLGKSILSIVCSLLGKMHLSVTSISAVFSLLYAPVFSHFPIEGPIHREGLLNRIQMGNNG